MRRVLLLAIASCGLLAIGPATALAQGHHHKRHHQRHHARRHIRKFGDVPGTTGSGTTSTAPDAGTVTSFTNGVLTITLADGTTTVSGTVTGDTEIECMSSSSSMGDDLSGDGGPDNSGSGDNSTSGSNDQGDDNDQGDQNDQDDQGDDNDDQGDDDNAQACDTSALMLGAKVHDAELSIGGSGATWKRVDLS